MKKARLWTVLFFLITGALVLACSLFASGAPAQAPAQPPADQQQQQQEQPAPPAEPNDTPTPLPTKTPLPKPTNTPEPPTPAPVGETVSSPSYDVTVVSARSLSRVYMGDYYYYPKDNQLFVEVLVKVSNLTGSEAAVPWKNVYVVEANGDAWYPNWAGFKAAKSGKTVDGASIGVNDTLDGEGLIEFDEDVFIRAIWFVSKQSGTTELLFGFEDSPNIVIEIE